MKLFKGIPVRVKREYLHKGEMANGIIIDTDYTYNAEKVLVQHEDGSEIWHEECHIISINK
jgi:hypothetical protein